MIPRERIYVAGQTAADGHNDPVAQTVACSHAAADETLTILEEWIRQRFTPALNTGSALDGIYVVGEAIRALRAELTDSADGKG